MTSPYFLFEPQLRQQNTRIQGDLIYYATMYGGVTTTRKLLPMYSEDEAKEGETINKNGE